MKAVYECYLTQKQSCHVLYNLFILLITYIFVWVYMYVCTYVQVYICMLCMYICVHMWINFDVRLMIVITMDIPSFLCHLISFTSLSPFYLVGLSLSCFPYSMSLSCFCFIKNKIKKNLKKNLLIGWRWQREPLCKPSAADKWSLPNYHTGSSSTQFQEKLNKNHRKFLLWWSGRWSRLLCLWKHLKSI